MFKQIAHQFDQIKGFLDRDEGQRLFQLALEASRHGPCLEIGSYCGKSTLCIGNACKQNNSVLFSIDHHRGSEDQQPGETYFDPTLFDPSFFKVDTFQTYRQTLQSSNLEDTVVPIVCLSEICARFWQTPISLLFIDGGHSYQDAFLDYQAWAKHLIPGGYLLFHDVFETPDKGGQGPHEVYQFALASGEFKKLPMTGSVGILQRHYTSNAAMASPQPPTEGAA